MFNIDAKVWTCYFQPCLRYRAHPGEGSRERDARRREERRKLKDAGFDPEKQFRFRSDASPRQKSLAKAQATALAKRMTAKTGVVLEVCEGSWL